MSRRLVGRSIKSGVVAAVGTVVLAAPAAAVTTVGSGLQSRANLGISCGIPGEPDSSCTFAQLELPDRPTAVPSDGVIVRWRLRTASRGLVALHVLRPAGGGKFDAVAMSSVNAVRPPRGGDEVFTFVTRIPVQEGDLIALDRERRVSIVYHTTRSTSSFGLLTFDPRMEDGESRSPDRTDQRAELLLNADLEPDGDGDGFGDETQDNCPSIPNDQTDNPCPSTGVNQNTGDTGDDSGGDTGNDASTSRRFRAHKRRRKRSRHANVPAQGSGDTRFGTH